MPKEVRNMAASVRARLLNLARERNRPFDLLLIRYVAERLLYRLASTKHRERFVLKGAMLTTTWFNDPHRPTRDLDLLGFGDPDPEGVLGIFRQICVLDAYDGGTFGVAGLTVDRIRDEAKKPPKLVRHNGYYELGRERRHRTACGFESLVLDQ